MGKNRHYAYDELRSSRPGRRGAEPQSGEAGKQQTSAADLSPESEQAPYGALLSDAALTRRGNAPMRVAPVQSVQRAYGNRAARRYLRSLQNGPQQDHRSKSRERGEAEGEVLHEAALSEAAPVQRNPNFGGPELARLPSRGATVQRRASGGLIPVQRDISGDPDTADGTWHIKGVKKEDALTGKGPSGIDISLKFKAKKGAPYSNKIGIVQIVKLTDAGGANVAPASLPALPATRRNSLLTTEDTKAGVEKGFFTDVLHNDFGNTNADSPQKGNQTQNYQGGTPVFGFKRSDDDANIVAAEITDFPGTTDKTSKLDFSFETVARGDDVQHVFGGVKWSFGIHEGKVVNESGPTAADSPSATFNAAVEKHRDFYTHEPASFYFEFDSSALADEEAGKIDSFLDYLTRNTDVKLSVQGFADQRGKADYNRRLAQRRSDAVAEALRKKGVDNARITVEAPGGATTQFTDSTSGPAATTDQDEDANRRGNRVVTVTFVRTPVPVTP